MVFEGTIYDKRVEDNILTLYIKAKEKLIIKYERDNLKIDSLSYGDKVLVKGVLEKPQVNSIPNTFNYKEYLYNKRIYYIVRATSINKISYNHNYLYTIKNIIEKKADTLKSSKYIKTLLIGDNRIDKDVMKSYRDNGISHLFSISGMHISFYVFLLSFYLDKVTYYKKIKYVIADIFLLLYLCIAYSSSLLRSVIMYLLFSINFI